MKKNLFYAVGITFVTLISCNRREKISKPNIILIMADDMGYECISSNGSTSYYTPQIDQLASNGIRFSSCVSQPLCTPSRVKIMTGLYNYRNYDYFGHLDSTQYTFGNLLQDAGYTTCIAGKWQLNGAYHKKQIPNWNDNSKPYKFGFDEYCLWQLTKPGSEGERYAEPLIEQNGEILQTKSDDYGPDIFSDYILNFIEKNQEEPFFVYYPMVLVHDPFVPTPDSEAWINPENRYDHDTTYFRDMVSYTDKIVGKIMNKLKELNLYENTIVIFTGDNGTHPQIVTQTSKGKVQGAKGNTIDAGTHVPLIISWPEKIENGAIYEELIEFSDFFPTFAELVGSKVKTDGQSFYPLLMGKEYEARQTAFVHYDPEWGINVNKHRNQFVRTTDYKLYRDGFFFHISDDLLEKKPLSAKNLTQEEIKVKAFLNKELNSHPSMKFEGE